MCRIVTRAAAMAVVIVCAAAVADGRAALLIGFQGQLKGTSGQPVPDGSYQVAFSLFDDSTGGNMLWTEIHPSVQTTNGMFSVQLGSVDSLDLATLQTIPLYLELQVEADPPMRPRVPLASVPWAGTAQRISGDIHSLPGVLKIVPPDPFMPADSASGIVLKADSLANISEIDIVPPDPFSPMDTLPAIQLKCDGTIQAIKLNRQEPPPDDQMPEVELSVDDNLSAFKLAAPQTNGARTQTINPVLEMTADSLGGNLRMYSADIGPGVEPVMEMNSGIGGRWSWGLFNPQPEPPGRPVAEMNTGVGGEFNWVMFNPQPEPPGRAIMEMTTNASGPSFSMTSPQQAQGGGLQVTNPMVEMSADSNGAQINLQSEFFDQGGGTDSTGIRLHVDSTQAEINLFGPASAGSFALQFVSDSNGGRVGIGTDPTNILTVAQRSATDPIADAWQVYSSRRWKENVKTIDNALEKVKRLRGVSFDWRADGHHDIGLIAEEVGKVIPEVVSYEENGVDARSVDYARLSALLIEAVKEQQETIDRLSERLDQISAQLQRATGPSDGGRGGSGGLSMTR